MFRRSLLEISDTLFEGGVRSKRIFIDLAHFKKNIKFKWLKWRKRCLTK